MKLSHNNFKMLLLKNIPIILFLLIFITFGIFSNNFLSLASFKSIIISSSYIGIIAIGVTFVLLTGGIDLSIGSVMYLSAATTGLLIENFKFPIIVAVVCGILVAAVVGLINAFCIVKLKLLPFIVTLSTMVSGKAIGLLITESKSVKLPKAITSLGSINIFGIPMPVVLFLIVVICTSIFLLKTQMGRQIYAVGNDKESAHKAGINTNKTLYIVYILCAILAGIGGIISVSQIGIVNAGFGKGEEFNAISAAVLGGASLAGGVGVIFPGTVLGAIMIQMIQSGLVYMQVDLYIQPLIFAVIIFIAVLLDSIRSKYISKCEQRNIRNEAQ